jgi:WD40 repeat protein
MPDTFPCPDRRIIERLVLDQLSDAEAELVEEHLAQCDRCNQTLEALKGEDTFLGALQAQAAAPPEPDEDEIEALIGRLKELRLSATASEATPAATLAGPALPPPPRIHAGPPLQAPVQADATQELYEFLAPPQEPGELGRLGSYRVLEVLGTGGMGVVFRAEDVHLQRLVALKVVRPSLAAQATARQRFLREARATAALRHDHIVTIYQVGEDRGVPFLAMELLQGESVADRLKREAPLPPAEVLRIGRQIADGLAAAHAHGLVHRDVKPGNIWLETHSGERGVSTPWFRVKLLDFGLARVVEEPGQLTQTGVIMGTPAYMAPEQAHGRPADARSDLFSLGCVLYHLATGVMPFRGEDSVSTLFSVAHDTPRPPRELNPAVPPALADLILQLLAKDPARRPASARAVVEALDAIASGPLPATTLRRAVRLPRRRVAALVAAVVLLAAGLTAAVVVIIRDKQGREVARVNVPEGGSVEVKDDTKERPGPQKDVRIERPPLAPLLPGEPLARVALVQRPAKLPGVRSWTIETRSTYWPMSFAYRPDGKRLAMDSYDGVIHIWEPQTGRLVQVLFSRHPGGLLAWSPDGRVLAAGNSQAQPVVQLWDAETGQLLRTLDTPVGAMYSLAWSSDGRRVLAYGIGLCFDWDAASGTLLRKVAVPCESAAVLSPDGKQLAGDRADFDGVVLWNAESGQEVRRLSGPKHASSTVAWSPDGKRVAFTGADGVHVWETETGIETMHHKDFASCVHVTWSPDGRFLELGVAGGTMHVVEAAPGARELWAAPAPGTPAWSPDGKTIAKAWRSGLALLDAATGKQLRSLCEGRNDPIYGFALSPDGQTLAVVDDSHRTFLSSTDTGQVFTELKDTTWPLAWSPDGKRLAAAGPKHAVLLWEDGGKVRVTLSGHESDIRALSWSPDGKRLASAADEKRVLVWDADRAERFREVGPFAKTIQFATWGDPVVVQYFTWSPNGRLLGFNIPEVGWHVWDVEQNKLANDPKQWKGWYFALAPDGRSALEVPGRGDVVYRLRDLATGQERGQLPHGPWMHPGAWSPDGRLLAVQGVDGIELWRADLRSRVRTLKTTTYSAVLQLGFSGDGKLLAALAGERLQLWETDTGRLRGILLSAQGRNGLIVAADGHYTGNEQVERGIVMVVQKDDGTQEVLEPADFEQKYGFKNEPEKVHLLQPLPPPLSVPEGEPLGPNALVREPAELPDVTSWTIETISARNHVHAVAYRPDAKRLATGGMDGTIRLWDPDSGKLVRMLVGQPVESLSWSKDGKTLAAGGGQHTFLWEVDTGRRLAARRDLAAQVVAWSPDGHKLARFRGSDVSVWEPATDRVAHYRINGLCQALAWSPDGKTIAVGLDDRTLRLWDAASGKETHKLEGHEAALIRGVAWSPDGKRLVTAAHGAKSFHVWDVATGKLERRFGVEGVVEMEFPAAAWSPDGKAVAIGGAGLFDPETGRRVRALDVGDHVYGLTWSADGKQLASVGPRGSRLLDAASGKCTHILEGIDPDRRIWSLVWSPDGWLLALGNIPGDPPRIIAAGTGERYPVPPDARFMAAWSPDGKLLAAASGDGTIRLWDAVTNRPVRTMGGKTDPPAGMLAWSGDGKWLAAVGGSQLWVWSAETGKPQFVNGHPLQIFAFAWSPDNQQLATSTRERVYFFDAVPGKERPSVASPAAVLAWSPDGKTLAAGPVIDEECRLIDAASGAVRVQTHGRFHDLWAIRWSPDGKTFSTYEGEMQLRVWVSATGRQLQKRYVPTLTARSHRVWSPDGRVLARSNGFEIHLCDADGWPLGVLLPGDPFAQLTITADGHYRGTPRVDRQIMMVVQKRDGTSATLTPAEFERQYGWKNEPDKVHLLPPPATP